MNIIVNNDRGQHILGLINSNAVRLQKMRESYVEQLQDDELSSDQNLAASAVERLALIRSQITLIDKQLASLAFAKRQENDGMLGYCLSCGDEIPMERIDANPSAVRCIDCENIVSIKNKTHFMVS